ncbi:MAG: phosphatidylglycerophosphatase A [Gammaproteobacteria bacterium]|nr:phosphatidylglycerophosphatase A [Gammaproteobacteria bacterium]
MALVAADLRDPRVLVACGFGCGFLPKAPGTWGSILGVGLWLLVPDDLLWQIVVCTGGFLLGSWLVERVCQRYGVIDAPEIVFDEIVGVWIALIGVPFDIGWLLYGFVWFRLFDILKPWPVGWADRSLKGGIGVMVDDVLAGLLALGVLNVSVFLIATFF